MNRQRLLQRILFAFASLAAAAALAVPAAWASPAGNNSREIRDEFFIVSEVHPKTHHLVLELPSQITMVMQLTPKTVFTNEHGERLPLSKIRAGDTVFINYLKSPKGAAALLIHEGPMTVQLLHKRYWNG
jgi:hypothetical protein